MPFKALTFASLVVAAANAGFCNPEPTKRECLLATATTGRQAFEIEEGYDSQVYSINSFQEQGVTSDMRITNIKLCAGNPEPGRDVVRGFQFTLSNADGDTVKLPYMGRTDENNNITCRNLNPPSPIEKITTMTTTYGWVNWIKFEAGDWVDGAFDGDFRVAASSQKTWSFRDDTPLMGYYGR